MSAVTADRVEQATQPAVSYWQIDTARSHVDFLAHKRLLAAIPLTVTGQFTGIRGSLTIDRESPEQSRGQLTFSASSVKTGNAMRDDHLKKADWLDVDHFPSIRFSTVAIEPVDPSIGSYRVTGELTVKDLKKIVVVDVLYTGPKEGARTPIVRISGNTELSRNALGLTWKSPFIKVADTVKLAITLEATQAATGEATEH
jgi:polyisoprenoid-binding protein YceI